MQLKSCELLKFNFNIIVINSKIFINKGTNLIVKVLKKSKFLILKNMKKTMDQLTRLSLN